VNPEDAPRLEEAAGAAGFALSSADESESAPAWACPFCAHALSQAPERCPGCGARAGFPDAAAVAALRASARTGYLLQALTPLCGLTAIPALLLAYARRGRARETWLASHFDWQVETLWGGFWLALAALAAGWLGEALGGRRVGATVLALAGMAALAWFIPRVARGWGRLADGDRVTDY
jgi:uncharacterized membrane protein